MANVCKCVDWFLVAIAAAEALEHNALISGQMETLTDELKQHISEEKLEDMSFRHALLGGYLTENMAVMALSGSLGEIHRQCGANIDKVKELSSKGYEAIKKRDADEAANSYTNLKVELIRVAQAVCANSPS